MRVRTQVVRVARAVRAVRLHLDKKKKKVKDEMKRGRKMHIPS